MAAIGPAIREKGEGSGYLWSVITPSSHISPRPELCHKSMSSLKEAGQVRNRITSVGMANHE